MGANFRIRLLAIIITLTFLLIPSLSLAESVPTKQNDKDNNISVYQEEPSGTPDYIPVELNMRENNQLSPELIPPGTADSSVVCPNGFVPNWWSIRKRYGRTEWRDVGTWETIKISKELHATGVIQFSIWVTFSGSGTPGSRNFEFIWKRNEDRIASVVVNDVPLSSGMEPYEIRTQANLINQTPFEFNDVFKLTIRCQISLDGGRILYGSPAHNSHVMMNTDPLDILEIHGNKNGIKGYFIDVFNVRYTELIFTAQVDGHEVFEPPPRFGLETVNNRNMNFVSWGVKLEVGSTYEIVIGIAYVPNDNTSVVTQLLMLKIERPEVPTWFGIPVWQAQIIIAIIVLVVLAVVLKAVYNRYQERKWMSETEK
jgi:hypothetical protein